MLEWQIYCTLFFNDETQENRLTWKIQMSLIYTTCSQLLCLLPPICPSTWLWRITKEVCQGHFFWIWRTHTEVNKFVTYLKQCYSKYISYSQPIVNIFKICSHLTFFEKILTWVSISTHSIDTHPPVLWVIMCLAHRYSDKPGTCINWPNVTWSPSRLDTRRNSPEHDEKFSFHI